MSDASTLRNFLVRDPHNIPLNCDFLDAALSEGRIDDAHAWLGEAPADVRGNAMVRMREARIALLTGDFAHSVSILSEVLDALPPGNVAAYHDLAYAQSCLGDDEAA